MELARQIRNIEKHLWDIETWSSNLLQLFLLVGVRRDHHVGVDGVDLLLPPWLGGDGILGLERAVSRKIFSKFSLFPLRFLQLEVSCPR